LCSALASTLPAAHISASHGSTMRYRALILASLLLTLAAPVRGQTVAPFDADLTRLSEILGALHYLRTVCDAKEGQKWRSEMQALIDAEAPSGERRSRMVASFNRG
jgi:uncharacterized protein (TIGR02301 family)